MGGWGRGREIQKEVTGCLSNGLQTHMTPDNSRGPTLQNVPVGHLREGQRNTQYMEEDEKEKREASRRMARSVWGLHPDKVESGLIPGVRKVGREDPPAGEASLGRAGAAQRERRRLLVTEFVRSVTNLHKLGAFSLVFIFLGNMMHVSYFWSVLA